jgi:hypothetical protein
MPTHSGAVRSAWDLGEHAHAEVWSGELEQRLRLEWERARPDVTWAVVCPIVRRSFDLGRRRLGSGAYPVVRPGVGRAA